MSTQTKPTEWEQEQGSEVYRCYCGNFSLEVWPLTKDVVCVSHDFDNISRGAYVEERLHTWAEQRWAFSVFNDKTEEWVYDGERPDSVLCPNQEQAQKIALIIAGYIEP
jgi:hypothetical protein